MMIATSAALAHGLYVVPQHDRDAVRGQALHTDQSPASQVRVEVRRDGDHGLVATGMTDSAGRFEIAVPPGGPYRVVVLGDEGHRAEAPAVPLPAGGGADPASLQALREDIARLEHRLRLQDLVGAIGYLVGLAGGLAWWHSRRRR